MGLLGGCHAFPDADWDVLLDVSQRVSVSRTNLRAAIQAAVDELAEATPDEMERTCQSLRRRVVAPALREMDQAIEDLGAMPTLLRLASGTQAIGTLAANLALSVVDPGTFAANAALHAVASVPLAATATMEALHRREAKRSLAAQPFWILREASRLVS